MLDEFADVFVEKPGLCNGVHEIHVTPDFKPRRLMAYKVPELLKPEVARQLQELLAVVKVVMCSRGGSASEVETHKNIYISSSQHIFR